MEIKEVIAYCLSKPEANEDYPFGPEPSVIKVGNKTFAILTLKSSKGYISLKCDPFIAETLRQQYPSVQPGYHLNKQHWNTVKLDGSVPDSEILWMVNHSYDLVKRKGLKKINTI